MSDVYLSFELNVSWQKKVGGGNTESGVIKLMQKGAKEEVGMNVAKPNPIKVASLNFWFQWREGAGTRLEQFETSPAAASEAVGYNTK